MNYRHQEREWTFVTKSGQHRQVLLSVTPVNMENGALAGYLGVAADITEHKASEQALKAQQRLMQTAIDNIPQFIFWKDTNSVYQGCNRNFALAAGVEDTTAIIGKTDYDLAWKKEEADFFRSCDRRVMDSLTAEYHILESQLQADGKQALLDTNKIPMLDDNGNLIGMLGTFEDITERHRVQKELSQSEESLRITLKSIADGVIVTDINGHITRMNPVAEELTGWPESEADGRDLSEVFRVIDKNKQSQIASPVDLVVSSGEITSLPRPAQLISRFGHHSDISASGSPIRTKEGETVGVVIVVRDISEELKIQAQLNQSQKLDAIGQLASGIAHDFNNMLGGIIGSAELLQNHLRGDSKSEKYLSLLLKSAGRAADLAKKLLAFSKQQAISSTAIDVHKVILETVSILENTLDKRIRILSDLGAEVSTVVGDNTQLLNVFLNIGINASHAMPDGGSLSFSTKITQLADSYCNASPFDLSPGSYLEIEIRDTGCGMPQEMLLRIFEPFFTTKGTGKGTGLGLAVAYGTISQHKGAISVYSEEDIGTSFSIYLPLTSEMAAQVASIAQPVQGEGLVLLVDDEYVMRVTGSAMLKEFGYDVLTAENGKKGLEVFRKNTEKIKLVVLDMIMPHMNGRDCFAAIRDIAPEARIVLSSGFSRKEDVQDLKEQGLAGFVQKPFRSVEFSRVIAKALKK